MKVVVLGSGVIGVTSAWYLAKSGHEVTVIDRQSGPALETSFANAGQVSFGYTTPWAAPGLVVKALKWMMHKNSPLIIRPQMSFEMMRWLIAMLGNCNEARYRQNKALMMRISDYSALCLAALVKETGIEYDARQRGTIQLFRTQAQMDTIAKDTDILKNDGVDFEILDANGCIKIEPGLTGLKHQIIGGLRTPKDETGDCALFTRALTKKAQAKGVAFQFDTHIKHLIEQGGRVSGVLTDKGCFSADAVLVALGSFSPFLLKSLGLRLPIYPVKGYSITVPIKNEALAPISTVLDETFKVAITRLGDRIRIGGMAELSGYRLSYQNSRKQTLEQALHLLFAGAADSHDAKLWSGLRPVTPDSVPVIGATRYNGLYINAGHGTLGWTMSTGSGRLIADIISNHTPEIDAAAFALSRYDQPR